HDGGKDWTAFKTGLVAFTSVRALAIDPFAPATLYVATSNGMYKSTTGGTTFTQTTNVPAGSLASLAIDPSSTPPSLYVATNGGVFKTTDRGASWNAFNNGLTSTS